MKQIIRKLSIYCSLFLVLLHASCADETEEQPDADHIMVKATVSSFHNGENTTALDGENDINNLQACLFENGVLTENYSLDVSSAPYSLQLKKTSGTLYLVGNAAGQIDMQQLKEKGITETEWLATQITADKGKAIRFFSAKVPLTEQAGGTVLPIGLERGVARIDLLVNTTQALAVKSITLKDVAQSGFLFTSDEGVGDDNIERQDDKIVFTKPLSNDSLGIAYVYGETNAQLRVLAEITSGGQTYTEEAYLPGTLKRNTIYTLTVSKEGASAEPQLSIQEWDNEEEILRPDFDSHITVNREESALPDDVQIDESGDALSLPCRAMDFTLTLDCNDELEFSSSTHPEITVTAEPASTGTTTNRFTVHKPLLPPGYPEETAKLYFKRKGLNNTYEEDCITFTLQENPIRLEGLSFDRTDYTCDFERYVDNELGRFVMPEDLELTVTFENEDPWIKVEKTDDGTNTYRVLGGWKPNDPKADGRQQAARLIVRRISDKQQTEAYTVVRRNFGLPVTYLNGIWWCRYNAIGNSADFNDQILSADNPAQLAGKTVQEYLKTCTPDEYLFLWNAAYEGKDGTALKAVWQDEKVTLSGWRSSEANHINKQTPKALSPDGYEMPTFDDYRQIFGSFVIPTSWRAYNPQLGGEANRCEIILEKRTDLQLDGHNLDELWSFSVRSISGKGDEPLTFYGVGCQWNNAGVNANWLLLACYNPNVTGWLLRGNNASLEHNGAAANNTRTLRFKKSPVEYIYE